MRTTLTLFFSTLSLVAFEGTSFGQSNLVVGKQWSYKKLAIVYQRDTLVMFSVDSTKNLWYLGKVNFIFNNSGSYTGTTTEGVTKQGTWATPNSSAFVVDTDTNQIISLTNNRLKLSSIIHYQDDSTNYTGTLLTELYTTPPVTSICNSIQSGDWRNPYVWSCGREPTIADVVAVNPGHTITITSNNAQAQRIIHNGGNLRFTSNSSNLFIKSN